MARAGGVFVLAGLCLLSAVAGTVYWLRVVRPASSQDRAAAAEALDAGGPDAPSAIVSLGPPPDPVQAALDGNSLLTAGAARALAEAWQRRGMATEGLGETALLMAIRGFGTLPAAKAEALRTSFDRLYAVLPPEDRAVTERLLGQIREGRAQSDDLGRAVALMDSGVRKMDEVPRRQFQDQYSAAVLVAIAMRDESDRIALAGRPVSVASQAGGPSSEAVTRLAAPAPAGPTPPAPRRMAVASPDSSSGSGRADPGEAHWRNRATQLRATADRAQATVRAAETDLRAAMRREYQPGCPPLPPVLTTEAIRNYKCVLGGAVPAARATLERAQADLERAKRQLDGLDDEARRAGAPPGWIR